MTSQVSLILRTWYHTSQLCIGTLLFSRFLVETWFISTMGHLAHETEGPWPLHFKHSHWWIGWSPSEFTPHYAWGTNGVSECKMGVKSTWIPTWHQVDHVFMVTWTMFRNHLLEVDLTQNHETMALWNLTIVDLLCFVMCEDPAWIEIHWNCIRLRARLHMSLHYTWGPVTTLHNFASVLGRPLDTSFGLSKFDDHSSWLVCEVAL